MFVCLCVFLRGLCVMMHHEGSFAFFFPPKRLRQCSLKLITRKAATSNTTTPHTAVCFTLRKPCHDAALPPPSTRSMARRLPIRAHHPSLPLPPSPPSHTGMASSSASHAALPTETVPSPPAVATTDSTCPPPSPSLLSDQFHRRLMPFQKEGIAFGIKHQGRVLIADEMGLGKTLQAIGVMLHFHQDFPVLVVVPSSVKFSWVTELERWTKLDPARIKMVRSRNDVEALRDADVVLLTYGMLSASAPVVEALQRAKPQVVMLDESHSIKSQNLQGISCCRRY